MSTSNNTPTNHEERDPSQWAACEEGTLGGLNQRLRRSATRRFQGQVVAGLSGVAAVAVLLIAFLPAIGGNTDPGGITCNQCVALMPDYHQVLTADAAMPEDKAAAVEAHIEGCTKCHGYFERSYPGVLSTTSAAGFGLISLALLGATSNGRNHRRG